MCYELIPYYLLAELQKVLPDKSAYYEYVVKQEARDIQETLKAQLGLPSYHSHKCLSSPNNVIKTDNQVIQVSSIITSFWQASDANINCSPAIDLTQDIRLKSRVVVVVGSHLITEKQITMNIDADLCIVGFQKHGGLPLNLNVKNGHVFIDQNVRRNITVNQGAKVHAFSEITKLDRELN